MRLKTRTWFLLSLVLFLAAAYFWRLGNQHNARRHAPTPAGAARSFALNVTNYVATTNVPKAAFPLAMVPAPNAPVTNRFAYRLSNTKQPFGDLLRNDHAVLLRNAFIDTDLRGRPEIPGHLQAKGNPGSYIVQARGPITQAFRDWLKQSGAEIISYVPNNAYLVRASEDVARNIAASPDTQALLTYEPYYKLDTRLLPLAVRQEPSPYPVLNVVAFPGATARVQRQLALLGATVLKAPEPTIFGDILTTKAPAYALVAISQIKEVQMLSVHSDKHPVNDLSRVKLRVSTNTITTPPASHYGAPTANDHLTGNGVLVAVADTGVDGNHPDLQGRVIGLTTDFDGHGTHVIGSLLGDGSASPLSGTDHASGSVTGAIFSGIAPSARAYVQDLYLPDSVLQQNTALTNALISNNSWGIQDNDYDIMAASYDAAVRDSLPGVTGEQEVAYVFAAGNDGGGGNDGLNGIAGSVLSPATAKNVITVGGIDQARFITNLVYRACDTNGTICETNQPWLGMTDSDNQVSSYSSRGNVGIGVEGVFGRFKPDVVAPGSMVVSTRSATYEDPNGVTNTSVFQYNALSFPYKATNLYSLNIPAEAVSVTILLISNALSPTTNVDLMIGADIDNIPTTFIASNFLTLDATTAPALRQGTLYYTIANLSYPNTAVFDLVVLLTYTNDVGNYYEVLKQLNDPLKPYYRYESGTSMAAPKVSGMLAQIQEYLGTNFNLRPSPALLKALLINGARSLSLNYNLSSQAAVNHQGWGLANISNSVPSGLARNTTNGPMRFFDQSITNALATGGTHVYQVTVPDEAKSYPLRISLVWSDAPGNPVASVKLVNDLNLIVNGDSTTTIGPVTNTAKLLWLGNSFPPGSDFTSPITISSTDTNAAASTNLQESIELARDPVNNVENVYIRPPLSGTYTVTVKGHRVNVNSVNSHSNSIVQDYALVVASGNVAPSNNVDLLVSGPVFTNDPSQRISALLRATNATSAGLLNQRVGANAPLIVSTNGATNQWSFFTYTNVPDAAFKYVAIITFFPPELSLPRNRDADIDLYVTRSSDGTGTNLFVLDPAAVSASQKSTSRGGTEMALFTNAQPDEVFSIGVKSEDQQAAQFNIFAVSSDRPFSSRDASNNIVARALPLPVVIPDGSPDVPGGTNLFIIVFEPDTVVRRAYLTNSIYHEEAGDLIGILSHIDPTDGSEASVTLNNHRTWTGSETVLYDDSEEGDLGDGTSTPPVVPPDGPGSLRDFMGQQAFGLWNFTIADNALFHTGLVEELTLVIEPASTNSDSPVNLVRTILPLHWLYAAFTVPADASNIQVCVETDGPVDIYVRRDGLPTFNLYDKALTNIQPPGACMDLGLSDSPPLSPGRYYVGVYNPSAVTSVRVHLVVTIQRNLNPNRPQTTANDNGTFLIDDATTNSTILVTNRGIVTSVEVDVRIKHPRVSDLALHLVSPQGTRILLAENRGHDTPNGYGVSLSNIVVTNFGARILDDGFEYVDSIANPIPPAGQIVSGWLVDSGDVDIYPYGGVNGVSHTGTNALDLNGLVAGSISTNVPTIIGQTYLLRFAYTRNPGVGGVPSGRVEMNGQPVLNFSYVPLNSYASLNWSNAAVLYRATNSVTRVGFVSTFPQGLNGGVLLDTIRLDEVELVTNGTLYATFTDNPAKAIVPIKFAPPPFGDTNFAGTNLFISGFEGARDGLYTNGNTFAGWTVRTNTVYVQSNNVRAYSDTNYLLLRLGAVSRPLPTIAGKEYVLQFATRTSRPLIYSTGVDEDGLPLPADSVDPHYFVSSNSFTRLTNAPAYVLRSNAPPMGGTWVNRAMPDSRWIGIDGASPPPGTNRYGFRTTFDLTGYDWRNVTLTGQFQSDGSATAILLNGNVVPSGQLSLVNQLSYRTGFVALTFTNGFLPGINTFELVVTNSPSPQTNTACGIQIHFGPDAIKATKLGDVTFDDLPGNYPSIVIPNGYRNLQWSNFGVFASALSPVAFPGYRNGMVSPGNVAGNRTGAAASIRSASAFDFNSAYISSVARILGLQLRVQGFVGNTLVYDNYYFNLNETGPSLIDFNYLGVTEVRFTTIPSTLFVMDNATIRFPGNAPSVYSSIGQIKLVGSYTNYFTASSDFWRMQNVTFVARSNNTVLEFAGVTPGVWLDHVQMRETGRKYYLPEEPFTPLIGQPSAGRWGLEVWDSRLGAAVGDTELVSWRLNLEYVRTNPPFALLRNHQSAGGTVAPGGLRYFAVDVTCSSANVTNTLMSLSPPGALSLLFNQDTFPTGSEPGDFLLIPNTLSNAVSRQVGQYPLLRSGRYYLAVKNTNSTPVNFLVQVDSDLCVKSTPTIGSSKIDPNGFAFTWSAEPGAEFIVEYAEDVAGPWMQVPQVLTSETGEFSFTDDGSSTGGFTPNRFYRLFRIR